jgi:hypothetical protein
MLKINNDYTVTWEENITHEQIINLIISFYSGDFSKALAQQLSSKDNVWKKKLQELFMEALSLRFEQELYDLMLNMNKPFFNHLDIKIDKKSTPFIHPLMAYKT